MREKSIHDAALLKTLRRILSWVPHRPHCATVALKFPRCTCDVEGRLAIAYDVVACLLLDLRKGTR